MEFVDPDGFDPGYPASFRGDPAEWQRRADAYLIAKIRELRQKEATLNRTADACSDLDVFLSGKAGDSGECVDGVLVLDSEREALVKQILDSQKKDVRTGLGEL